MDFEKLKKVYIIGIKGSGVVGVAEILNSWGVSVLGSDTEEKFFTDEILKKKSIPFFEGFSRNNIPKDVDLVVYSTAYNAGNNEEFAECQKRNLSMMSYPEFLAALFNEKYGIAVCGTHGKTTTSALLAHTLRECGKNPSAIIGSRVRAWEGNALSGQGEYFVIEADEYQNKLALYDPKSVILTNVDFDHPDFFPSFQDYKKVFSEFVLKIPKAGFLVVWGDSVASNEVAGSADCEIIKYGFLNDNNLVISKKSPKKFGVVFLEEDLGEFETKLVGEHNMLNAGAVIAMCKSMGIATEDIRTAIATFSGTKRRFEYVGERNGAILIDDYGHHPEEIRATLKGAREIYPDKNIIAVFHPHSFSRTEALLSEFSQSFDDADKVIVLDIYGSARENAGNVSSEDLVKLINKYSRDKAEHIATIEETVENLRDKLGPDDVLLAIGAGNVFEVVEKLKKSSDE